MKRQDIVAAVLNLANIAVLVTFGGLVLKPSLWGFDILQYCRPLHITIFAVLAAASMLLIAPAPLQKTKTLLHKIYEWASKHCGRLGEVRMHLIIFLCALIILTVFSAKYHSGNSHWMSKHMEWFVKRGPLASAIVKASIVALQQLGFTHVAAFKLGSILLGAMCATLLYRVYILIFGQRFPKDRDLRFASTRALAFLLATFASFGITRLAAGYIEKHIGYLFPLTIFQLVLVSFCQGKGKYLYVMIALFFAILAHIQALVVVPGVVLIGLLYYWRKKRLENFALQWLIFISALLLIYPHVTLDSGHYNLAVELRKLLSPKTMDFYFWSVLRGHPFITPLPVLFSLSHWITLADIHYSLSFPGIILLLTGFSVWLKNKKIDSLSLVSLMNFALFSLGTVFFHNFHHPIQRDWDIFGAGGIFVLIAAAALWRLAPEEDLNGVFILAMPVAGYITVLLLAQQAGILGLLPPPAAAIGFIGK